MVLLPVCLQLFPEKIHEVQKYMTLANYTTAQFFVQGNLDWWNSLKRQRKEVLP